MVLVFRLVFPKQCQVLHLHGRLLYSKCLSYILKNHRDFFATDAADHLSGRVQSGQIDGLAVVVIVFGRSSTILIFMAIETGLPMQSVVFSVRPVSTLHGMTVIYFPSWKEDNRFVLQGLWGETLPLIMDGIAR